jgi:beta-mannosidase
MRHFALIIGLFFALIARGADTLQLRDWALRKGESTEWIPFYGARNILHVLREAEPQLKNSARFSEPARQYHDSVASCAHTIKCYFDLSKKQLNKGSIRLELDYLQTFATLYLNGYQLGRTDNAFILWSFSLNAKILKENGNLLEIVFSPPRETVMHSGDMGFAMYPADNQTDSIKTAPYIRAPQQEFGWDFTFAEIYTGFRKCPQLIFSDDYFVSDARIQTLKIKGDTAHMELVFTMNTSCSINNVQFLGNPALFIDKRKIEKSGKAKFIVPFYILKPQLWWPQNYGTAHLYQARIQVKGQSDSPKKLPFADTITIEFGVRTVELIQEPDALGESFYFKVNGMPVFMEGANVIMPNEPFENDRMAGLSNKELQYVEKMKFNMLRIWGGGTYLPDAFYQWADRNGIMVWQDYMFACSYYPLSIKMEKNIERETHYQTARLAKHPCLALFCGNNEVDVARKNWGWPIKYRWNTAQMALLDSQYSQLFMKLLPNIVAQICPNISYMHSSPVSNWGKPEDFNRGDNHDWAVWHGEMPLKLSYTRTPRFMSEYGLPSFPSAAIIEKYWGVNSDSMSAEKLVLSYKGIGLVQKYLIQANLPFDSYEALSSSTRKLQAGHYRKMRSVLRDEDGKCMGNLFWQLNDAAPVMSWSVLDMDGNPKWEDE